MLQILGNKSSYRMQGPMEVLCERLKPLIKTLIGPFQSGLRPDKLAIDHSFTLRQTEEKTYIKLSGLFRAQGRRDMSE